MTAAPAVTIDEALADPQLLGAAFGDLSTWQAWRAVLKAAFGIELNRDEAREFAAVAGERMAPERRVRELWAIIGRRSGKSHVAALIASYIGAFIDHSAKLVPGEVGTILVLAASKKQADGVFGYCRAFFETSPLLRALIIDITVDEIRLVGNVTISVHTNNYRTVRGRTLLACIFDEVGFWRDETTSLPDLETYRAILPALATTGGMLVGISSPYAQRGLLYNKHRDAFGKDDPDVLVIQAGTQVFNPTIDSKIIEDAKRDDPEAAAAEWDAQFRGDLSTFIDRVMLENSAEAGVKERPFDSRFRYTAFCDPSGGQHDSMTLAIAHKHEARVILDLACEWKAPFSPPEVVEDMVAILRRYRLTTLRGDRYSAEWVKSAFRQHSITYVTSDKTRSEIYLDFLPQVTSYSAVLLENPRLIGQLAQLERRTGQSGRDSVDHMRGASDDLANAAAGALVYAAAQSTRGYTMHNPHRQLVANVAHANAKRRSPASGLYRGGR